MENKGYAKIGEGGGGGNKVPYGKCASGVWRKYIQTGKTSAKVLK